MQKEQLHLYKVANSLCGYVLLKVKKKEGGMSISQANLDEWNTCGITRHCHNVMLIITQSFMPDLGDVHVNGINVREYPRLVRYMLGYVAQDAGVDKVLTGGDLLEVSRQLAYVGWQKRKQQIEGLIEVFGLEAFIDRQSGMHSGDQMRLYLAIAWLYQPSILVLDEPTVGSDMESRKVTWQVMQDLIEFGARVRLRPH